MIWAALVTALLAFLVYRFGWKPYGFWTARGVPQTKAVPFFGTVAEQILRKLSPIEVITEVYQAHPNSRYKSLKKNHHHHHQLQITDEERAESLCEVKCLL